MEKLNLVINGEIRLPPGFRFHPTDEELVLQYLKRKACAFPLPASIIIEADLCKSDPWDLPGDKEQERYFFSTREAKYPNGNRSNRATSCGYWKATGLDKKIFAPKNNLLVGMKKTLVFYTGKPPNGSRTDWIMHEYRLANTELPNIVRDDWVLCRVFLKKRGGANGEEIPESRKLRNSKILAEGPIVFYNFLTKESSSSSASSGITQVEPSEEGREGESSSCNDCLFNSQP